MLQILRLVAEIRCQWLPWSPSNQSSFLSSQLFIFIQFLLSLSPLHFTFLSFSLEIPGSIKASQSHKWQSTISMIFHFLFHSLFISFSLSLLFSTPEASIAHTHQDLWYQLVYHVVHLKGKENSNLSSAFSSSYLSILLPFLFSHCCFYFSLLNSGHWWEGISISGEGRRQSSSSLFPFITYSLLHCWLTFLIVDFFFFSSLLHFFQKDQRIQQLFSVMKNIFFLDSACCKRQVPFSLDFLLFISFDFCLWHEEEKQ